MKETVDFSQLVSKAIEGDNAAFEELYRLTSKTAYCTAYLLLKNPSDAEDVLQNVYLKVFRNLSELKKTESFESWVKTIVENESINYIKKEKRINAPIVFIKNKSTDYSEEWNQSVPQEYMEREELRKSVNEILDGLSPEIRACIVLFHYEDKSLNEISEILDLPLGTVKSRLHNGRKQIEKEFNKLRKKDPTLYSVAAIPVLLSFLAFQAENIAVPAALSEAVLSAAGVTAAASAGSAGGAAASAASVSAAATGASTATGAAATAATSIAVKVAAVAVAGSVAVGGGVAVKNHVDNKAAETTAAYSSAVMQEETCTVAQTEATLTEVLTTVIAESTTKLVTSKTSTAADESQTSASSTTVISESTTRKQKTTRPSTTKKAATTAKETTTVKITTTKPTTTEKVTTTKPTTTKKETTTAKPTTTKPTTAPTTNPKNNYGTSGGVITEYTGSESNVSIPSSIGSDKVTAIGAGAFAGNTSIKSVSLPSSVTQIGQEAFADCTSLSSVSLPSSLELIGIGAFYGCTSLTSVTVPDGTETIGDEAFAECSSLGTVTIPESVTSISDNAFDGCDSLTIRCVEGSAAHDYAIANSIDYTLI